MELIVIVIYLHRFNHSQIRSLFLLDSSVARPKTLYKILAAKCVISLFVVGIVSNGHNKTYGCFFSGFLLYL